MPTPLITAGAIYIDSRTDEDRAQALNSASRPTGVAMGGGLAVTMKNTVVAVQAKLLEEARVLTIPGRGFGPGGEGYVRLTVCAGTDLIREAVRRITAVNW
ncbi:hypothetical protein [Streptomyces sp. MMG1121]|uniref:hypothetical protein n=1 Tax=Streptomyces sp. MMG1121 TaxID=1415544 RepID=UPI0006AFC974|nr:hypothetical protein [Streptomyces sp. MMG1121]KOV58068.1 hypothetical protein ADK64_36680 [Streptomyces sp. MMG1121]